MMTLSDVALLISVVFVGGGLWAAAPSQIFESHKDDILSGKCSQADGFSFGVGMARPRTASTRAAQATMDKARLSASANLVARFAIKSIVWPDSIKNEDRAPLLGYLAQRVSASAKIKDLEVVMATRDRAGICTVVAAAPDSSIFLADHLMTNDVLRTLLEPQFVRKHFDENRSAFHSLALAYGWTVPESLKGTNYNSWGDAQICEFCGITSQNDSKNVLPYDNGKTMTDEKKHADEVEEIIKPEFILPPTAVANENETIGF